MPSDHLLQGRHANDGSTPIHRPLRVGIVAPPWVSVPPPGYGGTELVVDLLARGLAAAGHEVVLFTTGDSTCPVRRMWHHPAALGTAGPQAAEDDHVRAAYAALGAAGVDVIHDHSYRGPVVGRAPPGVPVVATVHGELDPEARAHYGRAARHGVALVAISHAQRSGAPDLPFAAVIHHGIDVGATRVGAGERGDLVFLGRMSPVKGVDAAIRVARAAGRPLLIAAKMWQPEEIRYFHGTIEPLLGEDVTYLGAVAGAEKSALLEGGAALLNPIRWAEPFGLVMVESMARGTPVLTFPLGAASEIVEPGRTGFHCRDEQHMASLVDAAAELDRASCRARARERFDASRMVGDHLALYRRLINRRAPCRGRRGDRRPPRSRPTAG